MNININHVESNRTEDGLIAKVQFAVDQHKEPYEIVFYSKDGKQWGYSLHFLRESGLEAEIEALDQYIEENDEAFDLLLGAARQAVI